MSSVSVWLAAATATGIPNRGPWKHVTILPPIAIFFIVSERRNERVLYFCLHRICTAERTTPRRKNRLATLAVVVIEQGKSEDAMLSLLVPAVVTVVVVYEFIPAFNFITRILINLKLFHILCFEHRPPTPHFLSGRKLGGGGSMLEDFMSF